MAERLEKLGNQPCAHCGKTHKERKRHNPSAAPCKASISGDLLLCAEVKDPSDVHGDYEFVKHAAASHFGAVIRRKAQADPQVEAFLAQIKRLKRDAEDPATSYRDRLQSKKDADRLQRLHERREDARKAKQRQELAEADALLRKEAARVAAKRTRGLTAIRDGLPKLQNKALVDNIQQRLAGQHDGSFGRVTNFVRQPARGAYPALATAPLSDKEGRLLVSHESAVILSTDSNGTVRGMQAMNPPGQGAKYLYPGKGEGFSDNPKADHLHTVYEDGRVDTNIVFGGLGTTQQIKSGRINGLNGLLVDGALKALLAAALTDTVPLGTPGAQHHTSIEQIDYGLREIEAFTGKRPVVLIGVDAGDVLNMAGMPGMLLGAREQLIAKGWSVFFLWWGQITKDDGDIDEIHLQDVLRGSVSSDSFERLTGRELLAKCPPETLQASMVRLQNLQKFGVQQLPVEEVQQLPLEVPYDSTSEIEFYKPGPGALEAKLAELQARGFSSVLLSNPTGSGKTYWAASLEPEPLGFTRIVMSSPTALTLADQYGWTALRGKDTGRRITPDGRIVRADSVDDPDLYMEPNCKLGAEIAWLRGANANRAAIDTCNDCPHRGECSIRSGMYLADRARSEIENRIVADPMSLQAQNDFWDDKGEKYTLQESAAPGTFFISDEPDAIKTVEQLEVPTAQIAAALQCLSDEMRQPLIAVLNALKSMVKPKGYDVLMGDELRSTLLRTVGAETYKNAARCFTSELAEREIEALRDENAKVDRCWLQILSFFLLKSNGCQGWLSEKGLHFMVRNTSVLAMIQAPGIKMRLFMDATMSATEIELRFGVRCAVIQEEPQQTVPVRHIQIVGLGQVGYSRAPEQVMLLRHLRAVIPELLGIEATEAERVIGWIDTKQTLVKEYKPGQRKAAWLAGSRGSNYLQDVQALVLTGAPVKNITAVAGEWGVLTGQDVNPGDTLQAAYLLNASNTEDGKWVSFARRSENHDFRRWANAQTLKELKQGLGRGRFNRRTDPSIPLASVAITDHQLPWEAEVLRIEDVLGEAHVDGVRALKPKAMASAWKNLASNERTAEKLAEVLNTDLHSLAERCTFPDVSQQRFAQRAREAAAKLPAPIRTCYLRQEVDAEPELAAKLMERQADNAELSSNQPTRVSRS